MVLMEPDVCYKVVPGSMWVFLRKTWVWCSIQGVLIVVQLIIGDQACLMHVSVL